MHPALAVCCYFAFIFVGGALLAPWLYKLVGFGATISSLLQPLAQEPFHRFVSRSFMVLGVIGLWPFWRSIWIRSRAAVDLGHQTENRWARLGLGFMIGFGSLLIGAGLITLFGARSLNTSHTMPALLRHLANASLAAVLVSVLEEVFFRGAIFGALRKCFEWHFALLLSSALYAIVHFLERPPAPETVTWVSGLVSLAQMLRGFVDVSRLIPAFFSLLLAGWILGLAYHRTGSLYVSIGLHAGWIFWLKSYAFLTREQPGANVWIWGSGKLIDGWIALLLLAVVLAGLQRWLEIKRTVSISRLMKLAQ